LLATTSRAIQRTDKAFTKVIGRKSLPPSFVFVFTEDVSVDTKTELVRCGDWKV